MESPPLKHEAISEALAQLFTGVLGKPIEGFDQRLVEDLNIDSIQLLELIVCVNEQFNVDLGLAIAEGQRFLTFGAVVDAIEAKANDLPSTLKAMPTPEDGDDSPTVDSFFFNHQGVNLYAVQHTPKVLDSNGLGVLVCNPIIHEYFQCHRALRHLGMNLSELGFPVLRFEYHGMGDSDDSLWEARLPHWLSSIAAAAEELKRRTGVTRIALVGLRLGATLAALAANEVRGVSEVVLWNPIIDGKQFTDALENAHRKAFGRRAKRRRLDGELLGELVHSELLDSIASINLLTQLPTLPQRLLLLRGNRDQQSDALETQFIQNQAGRSSLVHNEGWQWGSFFSSIYWPNQSLDKIVSHFKEQRG